MSNLVVRFTIPLIVVIGFLGGIREAAAQTGEEKLIVTLYSACPLIEDPNEVPPDNPDGANKCGHKIASFNDGSTQRVDWNAKVAFELEARNPTTAGDLLIYEIPQYEGNMHFVGKAVDDHQTIGQTWIFDRDKNVLVEGGTGPFVGTMHFSISKNRIVYMDFNLPPSNGQFPDPYRISYFSQDDDTSIDSIRAYVDLPNDWLFDDDLFHFIGFASVETDRVVEFIDDYPDPVVSENKDKDSDNYFLRQNNDFKNLDIYYRLLLKEGDELADVKINIYQEEANTPLLTLPGAREDGVFKTGEQLHVVWDDVRDAGEFRDAGFYRLELEVHLANEAEPIKTPIEDGHAGLPGWQCPQDGLAIHDLTYKHRPNVHVAEEREKYIPSGPMHPFDLTLNDNLRLMERRRSGKRIKYVPVEPYGTPGSFPPPQYTDTSPVLSVPPSTSNTTLYVDLQNEARDNPFIFIHKPYLFHRSPPSPNPNYIFLHYWMYAPASDSPYIKFDFIEGSFFGHEGDWEMVQMTVQLINPSDQANKALWFSPFAATAAQHHYAQTLAWRIEQHGVGSDTREQQRYVETVDEGNRVNIYVSENAHAIYFRPGTIPTRFGECGTQIQYEAIPRVGSFDRTSVPVGVSYELIALDEKGNSGIYGWPLTEQSESLKARGQWGDFSGSEWAPAPFSPRYRIAKDRTGDFVIDARPVHFHDCARKLVDQHGNFDPGGQKDALTALLSSNPSEHQVYTHSSFSKDASNTSWVEWIAKSNQSFFMQGQSLAAGMQGNTVVAGIFAGPASIGTTLLSGTSLASMFLGKYDSEGQLLWIREAGGSGDVFAHAVAVSEQDEIYVAGRFEGEATFGATTLVSNGQTDIFLAKYSAAGDFQWVQQAGGLGDDIGEAVSVTQTGRVYLAGSFSETASFGAESLTSQGEFDGFLAAYDAGGAVVWLQQLKSDGDNQLYDVDIQADGAPVVTGLFEATATTETLSVNSAGGTDVVLAAFDVEGQPLWMQSAGGNGDDFGSALDVATDGRIVVTGAAAEGAVFDGALLDPKGGEDIFVASYTSNGELAWVQSAGSEADEYGDAISVDWEGNSFVTGVFKENLSWADTTLSVLRPGNEDIYVAKLDNGGHLLTVERAGGTSEDRALAILALDDSEFMLTGSFASNDAVIGDSTFSSAGYYADLLVAKLKGEDNVSVDVGPQAPERFDVQMRVFPNPILDQARLVVQLPESQYVTISVYDILGREVAQVFNGYLAAYDEHMFTVDGRNWSSGIYMLVVAGQSVVQRHPIVVAR